MSGKRVYLAGPLGFSESGRDFLYGRVIPIVAEAGFDPVDPWSLTDKKLIDDAAALPPGPEKIEAWKKLSSIIGRANADAIETSDLVFAVLDGTDVDSGTAAETGFAAALNKPVIGYRNDFRLAGDNDGSVVNLQVEYFINASGGFIINSIDELKDALLRFR